MTTVKLNCTCGKLRGELVQVSKASSSHVVCHCDDCQTFAHHLGGDGILDEWGGSEVFQVSAKRVKLTEGQEHLRCIRLSPKGLMRWYAGCCNCPVANGLPNPKVPLVGILHTFLDEKPESLGATFGPVRARVQARFAIGNPPSASAKVPVGLLVRSVGLLALWTLKGEGRPSPFFIDGNPVVAPEILSRERRAEMHALTGNQST